MMLKKIKIGSLFLINFNCFAYDHNPEHIAGYQYAAPRILGNLDNFADEKVIVLYRGVNFLPSKFNDAQRQTFIGMNHVGQDMYCSAAYEKAVLPYNSNNFGLLRHHAENIADTVNTLDDTDVITINNVDFSNHRYPFQQLYSNNCKSFFKELSNPSDQYEEIFENFDFTKNPLLSFSDRVKHPGKYAYGIKNFGNDDPLLPLYDINGFPHYPIVGKLFGIVLDEAAVEELQPLNVTSAHHRNELRLSDHFRNDILSERETSIAGYVPGDNVVFEMPLSVPSFNGNYKNYYGQKYGLSNCRYKNYQKFFTDIHKTAGERQEKERELLGQLIEATRQDNKLLYKSCLTEKITNLFHRNLRAIDAEIGKLTLEYAID